MSPQRPYMRAGPGRKYIMCALDSRAIYFPMGICSFTSEIEPFTGLFRPGRSSRSAWSYNENSPAKFDSLFIIYSLSSRHLTIFNLFFKTKFLRVYFSFYIYYILITMVLIENIAHSKYRAFSMKVGHCNQRGVNIPQNLPLEH